MWVVFSVKNDADSWIERASVEERRGECSVTGISNKLGPGGGVGLGAGLGGGDSKQGPGIAAGRGLGAGAGGVAGAGAGSGGSAGSGGEGGGVGGGGGKESSSRVVYVVGTSTSCSPCHHQLCLV